MKIYPVIHHRDLETSARNACNAHNLGCEGVFVISMDGHDTAALNTAKVIKGRFPAMKVGVNLLTLAPTEAVALSRAAGLDMTWSDNSGVSSEGCTPATSRLAVDLRGASDHHKFFASVAFKYQAHEPNPGKAAQEADDRGFIATTSGPGTGQEADLEKLRIMRRALDIGDLALASGVTPDNIASYKGLVTHVLVSTGISSDFHTFDPELLRRLMENAR